MTIRKLALGALVTTVLFAATSTMGVAQETKPTRVYPDGASAAESTVSEDHRLAIRDLINSQVFSLYRQLGVFGPARFTEDAELVLGKSRYPLGAQTGATLQAFRQEVTARCQRNREQQRPLISDVTFLVETDSSAHAKISGLLTNATLQRAASVATNHRHEGWFVKQGGEWKISRWRVYPDLDGCSR